MKRTAIADSQFKNSSRLPREQIHLVIEEMDLLGRCLAVVAQLGKMVLWLQRHPPHNDDG